MILQILGFLGITTLLFICFILSQPRNVQRFIIVGQDVFKWMTVVLLSTLFARILLLLNIIETPWARSLNSVVFILSVAGIVWSVYRHGTNH